jgi:hypothetical protein
MVVAAVHVLVSKVGPQHRLLDEGDVLALPNLDQVQGLERRDDVVGIDPCPS